MEESESKSNTKVGLIGDKMVGKTHLTHELTEKEHQPYTQTIELVHHEWSPQDSNHTFTYIDTPAMDNEAIAQIGSVYQYDILIFIFKDCDSFTKLYEFLVEVKEVIDSTNNHHVKEYWENLRKVIIVYSDFDSKMNIQLDQLFPILEEQIRNFCTTATILTFAINASENNISSLKNLIEVEPIHMKRNTVTPISQNAEVPQLEKAESEKQQKTSFPKQQQPKPQPDETDCVDVKDIIDNLEQQARNSNNIDININKPVDVHVQDSRKSYFDQRKSRIYKKIQDSFFGSSVHNEDEVTPPEAPEEYVEVKKEEKKQQDNPKLFQQFRRSSHKDAEKVNQIDKKLEEYNMKKEEELKNCEQVSELNESKQPSKEEKKEQKAQNINQTDMYTKQEQLREQKQDEERQQLIEAQKKEVIRQQLAELQQNKTKQQHNNPNDKPKTSTRKNPNNLKIQKKADNPRGCECLLM